MLLISVFWPVSWVSPDSINVPVCVAITPAGSANTIGPVFPQEQLSLEASAGAGKNDFLCDKNANQKLRDRQTFIWESFRGQLRFFLSV